MRIALIANLLTSSSCIFAATAAQAQTDTQTPAQVQSTADAGTETAGETSGEIIVTGSRLQASGYTATTPTSVLGQETINSVAPAAISDVLNRLPAVRLTAGAGQSQRNFGTGQAPIDLRGLSPVRTLTLVNGNRFTPTAENGTVDSSILPVSLIERIDVVTGGASAAYGSDAVAGVVNFVLRTKLEGVRGSVQQGVTQEGDANERTFSLALGSSFAGGRGHVIIGGDYSNNEGAGTIGSREWGRLDPYLVPNGAGRAAGTPAQSFVNGVTYSNQTTGGLITSGPLRGTAFGPGGTPYPFQYGQVFSTLQVGGVNERGNPNANALLLTPTSRRTALIRAQYDLTDAIRVFAEGNYGYTDANTQSGFPQLTAVIRADNPFLPAATRAEMVRLGLPTITVGRLLADYGGLQLKTTHETLRGVVGVEGKAFGDFKWDASYQYGSTHNFYFIKDVVSANFAAAVNAVVGPDGRPACGPLATNPNLTPERIAQVQPGCVPINIFGLYSPSAEALNYVTGGPESGHRTTDVARSVVAINLRGSPFSTWAGPAQFAIGGEIRHDTLTSTIDPVGAAGGFYAANNGANFSGAVTVREGYVEAGVPLAKGLPLLQSLELNAAARYADYTTSGGVTTWKGGVVWEPVTGLRFRGTRSRDIRAPSLADLYSFTQSGGLINITNPFNGASGRLSSSTAGNLALTPEKADTTTAGIVLSPRAAWGKWLNASVDFYKIRLRDAITTVAAVETINRCFAGQQQYCPAITRDNSAFGIANVVVQPRNLSQLITKGIDFALSADFRLGGEARLSLRLGATRTLDQITIDNGVAIDRAGSLQAGGVPKWAGSGDVTFAKGGFLGTVSTRFFSEAKYDATLFGPEDTGYNPALATSLSTNRFPAAAYVDLYAEQTIDRDGSFPVTVFGTVQNLANKAPAQFAATTLTTGGNPYDLIGRRFKVGVRFSLDRR